MIRISGRLAVEIGEGEADEHACRVAPHRQAEKLAQFGEGLDLRQLRPGFRARQAEKHRRA
jgi:hypothetical protein